MLLLLCHCAPKQCHADALAAHIRALVRQRLLGRSGRVSPRRDPEAPTNTDVGAGEQKRAESVRNRRSRSRHRRSRRGRGRSPIDRGGTRLTGGLEMGSRGPAAETTWRRAGTRGRKELLGAYREDGGRNEGGRRQSHRHIDHGREWRVAGRRACTSRGPGWIQPAGRGGRACATLVGGLRGHTSTAAVGKHPSRHPRVLRRWQRSGGHAKGRRVQLRSRPLEARQLRPPVWRECLRPRGLHKLEFYGGVRRCGGRRAHECRCAARPSTARPLPRAARGEGGTTGRSARHGICCAACLNAGRSRARGESRWMDWQRPRY